MLKIENLSVSYGNNTVLNTLNWKIPSGEIHGLVGLNGSGKTTLLNTIFGIKKRDTGVILFNNLALNKTNISYLETVNFFYPRITGKEYLKLFQSKNPDFDFNNWNRLFELPIEKLIEKYSTGMKKQLAFIGALAAPKPLLILDEPFNGVDLETTQKFRNVILALKKSNRTIIITSHILESLTGICDTMSLIKDKKIAFRVDKTEFGGIEKRIFKQLDSDSEQIISELINTKK